MPPQKDESSTRRTFGELSVPQLKQRIEAARLLRNLKQTDLGMLFAEDGLNKQEAGRLERGELPLTRVRLDALVRHLRVPEAWFTSEDIALSISGPRSSTASSFPADFAGRLRAARAYLNMSQPEFAEALGILETSTLKQYELGKADNPRVLYSLLARLPEVTSLPRSFFADEAAASDARLDEILATVRMLDRRLEQFAVARGDEAAAEAEAKRQRGEESSTNPASQRRRRR